ncbi:predicted protein [Naegleria gruberi]|uniref:sn-1-specific diacylglycerol lipase n=1 Tax=Naegleria gruberi TaxID=5762 RepID=D2V9S2_NAEGR|nr:uncharacterized protein NAEGRDRAFT_65539 [Naegleria gruberi]EFC46631.1 predicted protein [Naegleria gruberi]|eukprot:XP_002679375.1 predicted protein [Naegleria gruberi strain NEG-M]
MIQTTITFKYSRKNHEHHLPSGELNIDVLKHFGGINDSSNASSTSTTTTDYTPSLTDMITATAKCLQESYPSYRHLTIGDIVFGLGCLAKEHARQDLITQDLAFPYEYERSKAEEEPTDEEYKWWNEHCGINYSIPILNEKEEKERRDEELQEKLLFAKRMVYYANLAYANVADESERNLIEKTIFEEYERRNNWFSGKPKYTKEVLRYLESLRFEKNVQYYVNKNATHQQAFFVKLDHETKSVIIALRGTSSVDDIFTNLTLENSTLKVHRYYGDYKRTEEKRQHLIKTANLTSAVTVRDDAQSCSQTENPSENYCETDSTEAMIEGKVHAGYINTARWVIGKIEDCLLNFIFNGTNPYSNYRIICTGHSYGGGLASVVAILLRELFLKRFKSHHITTRELGTTLVTPEPPLPDIEAISYASSSVFSENLSNWCRSFVTTFIIGADRLRLEINQTNWEEKLAKFFEEHSKIANVATKLDGFLLDKGYVPIFQTKKTLITSSSKVNLSLEDGTIEMDNSESKKAVTTLLNEMNEMNTNITTLYPPGTIFLIIPDLEQMNSKDRKKKDLSEALFSVFNEKIFVDEEPENPAEAPKTTEPKEEKSLFSSLVSTVKTVYTTVVENIKEEEENPYLAKFELHDLRSYVQPKHTTVPTELKFYLKRVDVKQFERIILSRFLFSHHSLIGYKHAFDSLINLTQLNL